MIIVPPVTRYVDASYFQSAITISDYKAAGYTRIAHRATYADTGVDSAFASRWPAFTGMTRQAYHFAYDGDTPDRATAHFLDTVNASGGFKPGDEAMLDCEWFQLASGEWVGLNPAHGKEYAAIWNAAVATQEPQARRFFYGNAWWFEQAGITAADFPNVGMITASYGASYTTPAGWDHSCIWQYTDRATVPGFPGELVDFNEITCPTQLEHLTFGDTLSQADIDAINAHTDDKINALLLMIGQRFNAIDAANQKNAGGITTLYGAQKKDANGNVVPVDPTHTGIGDLARVLGALPNQISSAVAAHVQNGGVDPNVTALLDAVNALNNRLATIQWTLKAN